jgi:hypothetical protein
MALTRVDRERINDSRLKIQSAASSLDGMDPEKVPNLEEIQTCLADAQKSLSGALRK